MVELLKKVFQNGNIFQIFQKNFLANLIYAYQQAMKQKNYLKSLGVKKVKFIGNLKFSESEKEQYEINKI